MKKLLVALLLFVVALLAFVYKDAIFGGQTKVFKDKEYSLIATSAPNKDVLHQIPEDAFFLAYQLHKDEKLDYFLIKYLQITAKVLFEDKNFQELYKNNQISDEMLSLKNDFIQTRVEQVLEKIAKVGIKNPYETYFYNVGIRPVIKIAVDETKARAYFETTELDKLALDSNSYYSYNFKDIFLDLADFFGKEITPENLDAIPQINIVFALKDGFLTISLDSEFLDAQKLEVALGFSAPKAKFDIAKFEADLEKNKISTKSSIFWLDMQNLTGEIFDEDKELIQLVKSLDGEEIGAEDLICLGEAKSIIDYAPVFVFSTDFYADGKQEFFMDSLANLNFSSKNFLTALQKIEGNFTKLDDNAALAIGLGFDLGQVYNFIKYITQNLNAENWQCEEFNQLALELESFMPKLNILNMFSWSDGASFSATGNSKADLSLVLGINSTSYKAMSGYLDMASGISGMNVLTDGKNFSNLQEGETAKIEPQLLQLLTLEPSLQGINLEHNLKKLGNSLVLLTHTSKDKTPETQKNLIASKYDSRLLVKISEDFIKSIDFSAEELAKIDLGQLFPSYFDSVAEYEVYVDDNGLGINSKSLVIFKD